MQYAVKASQVFVIEANPRASRTVPFVAKATGVPLAKVAARVMAGATLAELRAEGLLRPPASGGHVGVKEAVLPFNRFPDVDTLLGPEMRSTGEVMGIDATFGLAFAKSQMAAGDRLPECGRCSSRSPTATRRTGSAPRCAFAELGFSHRRDARAPRRYFEENGVPVETVVAKVGEQTRARRRRRAHRSGQGRSSWSTRHAAAARAPTARTSARRPTCTGAVPHDGRGGARRGGRHRRLGPTRSLGATLQEYHADGQGRLAL